MAVKDEENNTFDDEAEAEERCPFLYGREHETDADSGSVPTAEPDSPPELVSSPPAEPDAHVINYHWLNKLSDDLLPDLDFYRFDNLFGARPARAFLDDKLAASPELLFADHWRAGEMAILFADTGSGKSILAVQIAQAIACGMPFDPFVMTAPAQRVVYVDLELTDSQFAGRYRAADTAHPAHFPFHKNFIRCSPRNFAEIPDEYRDYTAYLTASMVEFIEFSGARVVIIDNISWLNNSSQIGHSAARVMKALQKLKKRLGLSILVLTHTPKRRVHSAMTINDLQGSKMLSNFADSIFAMGTSRRATDLRYLKAIKHRSSAARASESAVATVRLVKDECFLGFRFEGTADERDHVGWLSSPHEPERLALIDRAEGLAKKQFTQREIARELGVSAATVNRCLKTIKED